MQASNSDLTMKSDEDSPDCQHPLEHGEKMKESWYLEEKPRLPDVYNRMRLEKELVDVFFKIGATVFPAHRNIMTAEMKFFKKFLKHKDSEIISLDETGIGENVFEYIVEFAYLGMLRLNPQNWDPLYRAAVYMDSGDMKASIEKYLCEHVENETFFTVWDFGEEFDLKILPGKLIEYMHKHFEEFTALDENQTSVKLLDDVNLEERRFFDAIKWVKFDSDQALKRRTRLHIFLRAIPLESLSTEFLNTEVAGTSLMSECCKCLKLFIEACFKAGKAKFGEKTNRPEKKKKPLIAAKPVTVSTAIQTDKIIVPRSPPKEKEIVYLEAKKEYLFAIGGIDRSELRSVSKFDLIENLWTSVASLETPRSQCNAAVIENRIYVAGGCHGKTVLSSLEMYDTTTAKWVSVMPMKYARSGCGVASINGKLYVSGGKNQQDERLAKFECYDPNTNRWEELASMKKKRSGGELVAFSGSLYAIGGCSCYDARSVERYDIGPNKWTQVASTRSTNLLQGSAVLNQRMYVCGEKLEVYLPELKSWKFIADAPNKKAQYRLTALNGRLLLMGGFLDRETSKASSLAFEYDFEKKEWSQLSKMDAPRAHHASVTLEI